MPSGQVWGFGSQFHESVRKSRVQPSSNFASSTPQRATGLSANHAAQTAWVLSCGVMGRRSVAILISTNGSFGVLLIVGVIFWFQNHSFIRLLPVSVSPA